MKLDAQEIKDLVKETESKRADWANAAAVWESDWQLSRYADSRETKQDMDGVDTIVSPDPYNVIQILHRHIADEPRIEIPTLSPQGDDEERSEKIEEFLVAYEQLNNKEQGTNLIHAKVWQSGVLGRGASQTLWMEPLLEKQKLSGKRLPIAKRKLDPRNAGVNRGAMGVNYGYHKYKASRSYIEEMYPSFKLEKPRGNSVRQDYYNDKYEVIDFWPRHEGGILHQVVIDGKFAVDVKTDFPDVPIIEWYADGAPLDDELSKSLGLLHPIHELWKMKCDMWSRIATGIMLHYDPAIVAKGHFSDAERQAIQTFGPGTNIFLNESQTIEAFRAEPNVPMAEKMLEMLQSGMDQATVPGVSYGEGADGQSGYAINNLQQQANGRFNIIRSNIETAMESEYELFLAMVEVFAPDEGLTIYGGSTRNDRGKPLTLKKSDIKGNYANRVMLKPEQPMGDSQQMMTWMQAHDKRLIDDTYLQNRIFNVPVPRDIQTRIRVEDALKDPELAKKANLRALQKSYKQDDWELTISGTSYEQIHEQEQQWREQKRQEAEQAKAQRAQEKEQKRQQELLATGKAHLMPDGTFMEGPPMLPPPPMPPGMPPGMSMPPEMAPSLPPSPGMSMPTGMGGAPQDSMQPQGIPGVPPQMSGQMDPNSLGLQGAPPGTFQQLTGQPELSDEEMMRRMGGLPPQG